MHWFPYSTQWSTFWSRHGCTLDGNVRIQAMALYNTLAGLFTESLAASFPVAAQSSTQPISVASFDDAERARLRFVHQQYYSLT